MPAPPRRSVARSSGPWVATALAERFGVSRDTIRKWRKRDTLADGSHTAHGLLHKAHVLNIKGMSYRLRDLEATLTQAQTGPPSLS